MGKSLANRIVCEKCDIFILAGKNKKEAFYLNGEKLQRSGCPVHDLQRSCMQAQQVIRINLQDVVSAQEN